MLLNYSKFRSFSTKSISLVQVLENDKGKSFFSNVNIPVESKGKIGDLSRPIKVNMFCLAKYFDPRIKQVKELYFRITPEDYDYPAHRAPQRQIIVNLKGLLCNTHEYSEIVAMYKELLK